MERPLSFFQRTFENVSPATAMMIGAAVLLSTTLLRAAYRRRQRQAEQPSEPAAARAPAAASPMRIGELEVRLYDIYRELDARVETKIHVLNELILQADARIAELRKLESVTIGLVNRKSAPQAPDGNPDQRLVIELDGGPDSPPTQPAAPFGPDRFSDIYALADSGLSNLQISLQTSRPPGEIELILGLRRRRQQAIGQA